MARRLGVVAPRRAEDSEDVLDRSESTSPHSKLKSYPHLTLWLLVTVVCFFILYAFGHSGFHHRRPMAARHIAGAHIHAGENGLHVVRADDGEDNFNDLLASDDGDLSSRPECRVEICRAIPILQEVYGKILHRTLHIGPGTCGVVSTLLKEEDVEVWGIQPFDMKGPIHPLCENFVQKGIIRISDAYKPLPYRKRSFSLVLVTGTLDQMKPKELNQTLSNLATMSSHSIVLVVGNGLQRQSFRRIDLSKPRKPVKPRNRTWWQRRLGLAGLKEDEEHTKRFENLQSERSYKTAANIFHLHVPESG